MQWMDSRYASLTVLPRSAALLLAQWDLVNLTVIDLQNHHLASALLLYQVATAALPCTHTIMSAATGIDTGAREVICSGQRVVYDS
jgi:hypothetical protein